ncbi:hypothetical protein ACMFMG_011632 [Clarireedia jacksonii]
MFEYEYGKCVGRSNEELTGCLSVYFIVENADWRIEGKGVSQTRQMSNGPPPTSRIYIQDDRKRVKFNILAKLGFAKLSSQPCPGGKIAPNTKSFTQSPD